MKIKSINYTLMLLISGLFPLCSFADEISVQVVQKCSGSAVSMEYPLRETEVYVGGIPQPVIMRTDEQAVLTLDKQRIDAPIMLYLATHGTIYAGCYSDLTLLGQGKIVLKGLCPQENCHW